MRILVQVAGVANMSAWNISCSPHQLHVQSAPWSHESRAAKGWTHHRKVQHTLLHEDIDLVWLVDSDIVPPASFDCHQYFNVWSSKRPLISQPTIVNQLSEFSASLWSRTAAHSHQILKSHWIEQQAPLFNATYLKWFYETPIVKTVLDLQRKNNVAWGLDWIWCKAAAEFDPHATSCACINVPLVHMNTKTLGWQKNRRSYIRRGFKLLEQANLRSNLPCREPKCCKLHPWFYMQRFDRVSSSWSWERAFMRTHNFSDGTLPNAPFC